MCVLTGTDGDEQVNHKGCFYRQVRICVCVCVHDTKCLCVCVFMAPSVINTLIIQAVCTKPSVPDTFSFSTSLVRLVSSCSG